MGPWIVVLILFSFAVLELFPQIRWVFGMVAMLLIFLVICIQFIPNKYTDPKKK